MDLLQALRLDALAGALIKPQGDLSDDDRRRFFRRIFRWYSREFATPLHLVEELPVVDVLRNYYEAKVDEMDDEALEAERLLLIETEAERAARVRTEEAEKIADETFFEEAEAAIAAEEAARGKKRPPPLPNPAPRQPMSAETSIDERPGATLGGAHGPREAALPEPVAAAEFRLEFADDAEFARDLEGLGALDQPAKKR